MQCIQPDRKKAIERRHCEAFMYILLLHSNATNLATLHQTNRVNALHMVALMLASVVRIICIAIEQSVSYSKYNYALTRLD